MRSCSINIEVTANEAAVAMSMSKQSEPHARSLGAKIWRAFIITTPTPTKKARGGK